MTPVLRCNAECATGAPELASATELQAVQTPVAQPRSGGFVLNLASNLASFGISLVVGVLLTPYLIRNLGVAAYGLIPLAVTLTSYLSLLTAAMNSSVGRFTTIALERRNIEEADRFFNTSLWGTVLVVLVLTGPTLYLSSTAIHFFNVPRGYEQQFQLLLLCTACVLFMTALASPFGTASFARNRFDLANVVNISGTVIRAGSIVVLFQVFAPRVVHVGAGMILGAVATVIGSVMVWRYLTPMLTINPRKFSSGSLRQMAGTGGWMLLNQIGSLLYLSIDLIVVNKLLGAQAGGQYGAVLIWSVLLRSLAGVLATGFGPTILSLYARGDSAGLIAYSKRAVKFVGLTMALPIGLICGLSRPLLRLWLGPDFEALAPLMSLLTIHLCVNLAVLPLFNVQVATNHVRLPGILTLVMGLGNLGLALLLAGPIGWGMYGVAGAGAIMLAAKNLVFTPAYAAHILGRRPTVFYREMASIIGLTVGLALFGWSLSNALGLNSWGEIVLAGMALTAIGLAASYKFLLDTEERLLLKKLMGYLNMHPSL